MRRLHHFNISLVLATISAMLLKRDLTGLKESRPVHYILLTGIGIIAGLLALAFLAASLTPEG